MLTAYKELTASRPPDQVHMEYFSAEAAPAKTGGYRLDLRRSGRTIEVDAGETMLDALLNAGVDVPFACSEGVCGTCQIAVLDGVPDHRDQFLTASEQASNRSVMVCCSGSRTQTLALDL